MAACYGTVPPSNKVGCRRKPIKSTYFPIHYFALTASAGVPFVCTVRCTASSWTAGSRGRQTGKASRDDTMDAPSASSTVGIAFASAAPAASSSSAAAAVPSKRKPYKCGKCGQLKVGADGLPHRCTAPGATSAHTTNKKVRTRREKARVCLSVAQAACPRANGSGCVRMASEMYVLAISSCVCTTAPTR